MPIEIRRFGVGHRRPDGPPGTTGVDRPGHPHRRAAASISELAFARGGRIEPHANPNTTWFIVIEGGGWVAGRRGAAAGRGRRGGPLAAGRDPRRVDRLRPDAGDRRRVRRRRRRARSAGSSTGSARQLLAGRGRRSTQRRGRAGAAATRAGRPATATGGRAASEPAVRSAPSSAPSWPRIRAVAPQTLEARRSGRRRSGAASRGRPLDDLDRRVRAGTPPAAARRSGRPRPGEATSTGRRSATRHDRRHPEVADRDPERLEPADDADAGRVRVEADLLGRLAERRRRDVGVVRPRPGRPGS